MSGAEGRSTVRRVLSWLGVVTGVITLVAPVALLNARVEGAAGGTGGRTPAAPPATIVPAGTENDGPMKAAGRKVARRTTRPRAAKPATFLWPVRGAITSPFGPRGDEFHHGLDIGCVETQPIHASYRGRVIYTGDAGAYGNTVVIDHGGTWQTLYAHLKRIRLQPGDWASPGEVIGRCGSTGRSTGSHLHLEIRYDGYVWDPLHYLRR